MEILEKVAYLKGLAEGLGLDTKSKEGKLFTIMMDILDDIAIDLQLLQTGQEELVEALTDGQRGTVIVDETPFYGTMGGQQADIGEIVCDNGRFKVEDTIHLMGGKIGHVGIITEGMLKTGDKVTLRVCEKNRLSTGRNHSATHLLQKALRTVLGDHVEQAGSYVDGARLRFDFTHFSAMTPEELKKVEDLVNEKIREDLAVVTEEMSLEEAKKSGAMALSAKSTATRCG